MVSTGEKLDRPKALLFDVFGTVVDWRLSVSKYLESRSCETLNSPSSSIAMSVRLACAAIDWPTFAQEWRASYYDFTNFRASHTIDGPAAAHTVDDHHHEALLRLVNQYGIRQLWTDEEVFAISRVWHCLDGWPDSTPGLKSLHSQGFTVCTLSNSNVGLLEDMSEFAHLPWSRMLCAENMGKYKPNPSVYIDACKALNLDPGECSMVAAHLSDLRAAKACGLQAIYIERSQEESWSLEKVEEAKSEGWVDIWIGLSEHREGGGILELAAQLATPHASCYH